MIKWRSGGFLVAETMIPPFSVEQSTITGIAVPGLYSDLWLDVLTALNVASNRHDDDIRCRIWTVCPQLLGRNRKGMGKTVGEYVERRVLGGELRQGVVASAGVRECADYNALDLTARVQLDICIAMANDAKVLLLCTAGMDPDGIKAVYSLVRSELRNRVCVDLIARSLVAEYRSIGLDGVVECWYP